MRPSQVRKQGKRVSVCSAETFPPRRIGAWVICERHFRPFVSLSVLSTGCVIRELNYALLTMNLHKKNPGSHHATTRPVVGVVGKRKLNAFFAEQVAHSKELRYAPTTAFHAFAPTLFPKVFSQTWRSFSGNQDILELAYSAHSRLHFCKKSITLSKLPQEKNVLQATTANCIRKRHT